jgi:hypothetical protein
MVSISLSYCSHHYDYNINIQYKLQVQKLTAWKQANAMGIKESTEETTLPAAGRAYMKE